MLFDEDKTKKIIHACLEVHNYLGYGFLEAVYQEALEREFVLEEIPYVKEQKLKIEYKGSFLEKEYFADFVCYDSIVVELKAGATISNAHKAQVMNYLRATGNSIGLIINFGRASLQWERISTFNP